MSDAGAAQVTPEALFTMMAAFKNTAVLRSGIELGVFDALADGPLPADEVAARLSTDPRGTRLLLNALAGLRLLVLADSRYELAPGAAELLVSTSPQYCGGIAQVASSHEEWDALGRLSTTVRRGGPVPGVDAEAPNFEYWVDFARHTTFGTVKASGALAGSLHDWAASRDSLDVLDVGCGHGLFGFTFAAQNPGAHVWAQDWPNVLTVAEEHAKRLGVSDRVSLLPGDAFTVDLAGPYDLIIVANVLFHFSESTAASLLDRLTAALKPGGRLAIVGFTSGDLDAPAELHSHLLGLLQLSWTAAGEMHSTATYQRLLAERGLTETVVHARPNFPLRIILASGTS